MNHFSQINSEKENPLGEYVFCCEHRFFSDYANKLVDILADADWSPVLTLSQMLKTLRNDGGRVFLCGNGGSAANAVHLANDLVYAVTEKTGAGIDAVALSTNPAVITCLGNDVGYENIYSEQLAVAGKEGDILLVFSGSGNSPNVINAIETARTKNLKTVAVVGFDGGKCKQIADLSIHFPVNDMQIAEDLQLTVGHMVMKWLKKEIQTDSV